MRLEGWVIVFSLVQITLFYLWLTPLTLIDHEPVRFQVARNFAEKQADIVQNALLDPVEDEGCDTTVDDQTIQLLLSKIHKAGAAVKFQHEEESKRRTYIPVKATQKLISSTSEKTVKIATYNLWNVNNNWEKRMEHIAEMFSQSDPDIIAFQEVRTLDRKSALTLVQPYRMNKDLPIEGTLPIPSSSNTMNSLVFELLPQYQWAVFVPMAGFTDGTQEGVSIFSKHPIVDVEAEDINVLGSQFSDRNTRGVLRAKISLPQSDPDGDGLFVDIFNTHLTYDNNQQCFMIVKLLDFLEKRRIDEPNIQQVVLGDLNTYLTAEWPIDFISEPFSQFSSHAMNPCHSAFASWIDSHQERKNDFFFVDVWDEAFPRQGDGTLVDSLGSTSEIQALGHTFPAYKDSSLVNCRPDRILRRKGPGLQEVAVSTFGDHSWFDANDFQRARPHPLSDHLGVMVEFILTNLD